MRGHRQCRDTCLDTGVSVGTLAWIQECPLKRGTTVYIHIIITQISIQTFVNTDCINVYKAWPVLETANFHQISIQTFLNTDCINVYKAWPVLETANFQLHMMFLCYENV